MIILHDRKYFACPCCGYLKRGMEYRSFNTCGFSQWSDGVNLYPMFPSFPAIFKCHFCGTFFWSKDKIEFDINPYSELSGKIYKHTDSLLELTVHEYYEAIESNLCNSKEIEKMLRIQAWHRWNDTLRGNGDKTVFTIPKRVQHWRYNLNTLLNLLDESKEEECLIKAEVLRNLRRYREAKALLFKVHDNKHQEFINKLIFFCEKEEWEVKRIK
ncbi:MAG: hypothetical protein V1779_08005 [bacterium]